MNCVIFNISAVSMEMAKYGMILGGIGYPTVGAYMERYKNRDVCDDIGHFVLRGVVASFIGFVCGLFWPITILVLTIIFTMRFIYEKQKLPPLTRQHCSRSSINHK